ALFAPGEAVHPLGGDFGKNRVDAGLLGFLPLGLEPQAADLAAAELAVLAGGCLGLIQAGAVVDLIPLKVRRPHRLTLPAPEQAPPSRRPTVGVEWVKTDPAAQREENCGTNHANNDVDRRPCRDGNELR